MSSSVLPQDSIFSNINTQSNSSNWISDMLRKIQSVGHLFLSGGGGANGKASIINAESSHVDMNVLFPPIVDTKAWKLIREESNNKKFVQAKGYGILSHGAKPELWEQEKSAWERAAVEKYGSS